MGKSQSAIANKLRILRHSAPVLDALRASGLTERHARALLKLPTEQQKLAAIETISKLDMNVARAEQYIDSLLCPQEKQSRKPNLTGFINHLTQSLAKMQSSGIAAVSERKETEEKIVLTITFPK